MQTKASGPLTKRWSRGGKHDRHRREPRHARDSRGSDQGCAAVSAGSPSRDPASAAKGRTWPLRSRPDRGSDRGRPGALMSFPCPEGGGGRRAAGRGSLLPARRPIFAVARAHVYLSRQPNKWGGAAQTARPMAPRGTNSRRARQPIDLCGCLPRQQVRPLEALREET